MWKTCCRSPRDENHKIRSPSPFTSCLLCLYMTALFVVAAIYYDHNTYRTLALITSLGAFLCSLALIYYRRKAKTDKSELKWARGFYFLTFVFTICGMIWIIIYEEISWQALWQIGPIMPSFFMEFFQLFVFFPRYYKKIANSQGQDLEPLSEESIE
eukprot:NODE_897_length_3216_cov_0.988450.p1 type:complete len:157 gc:universal NODE_897_length_3216_cov_0.988450:2115-2585(+)